MGRPMLSKVFMRDFCEEWIFGILRAKKHPFEKWGKEPLKHRAILCKGTGAGAWRVQSERMPVV